MRQISVFMIKPEAFSYHTEILQRLEREGLTVLRLKTLQLSPRQVQALYEDTSSGLVEAGIFFLSSSISIVALVEGKNAIKNLYDLAGHKASPALCSMSSLRFIYGIHTPVFLNGVEYFRNGIHRCIDEDEVKRDMSVLDLSL